MHLTHCILLLTIGRSVFGNSEISAVNHEEHSGSHILSRRKRYLIFPDGSSLQFVLCLQLTAVIPIYPIFLFGDTAALAWELPTDPKIFYYFKKNKNADNRRGDDINDIYHLDSNGRIAAKFPTRKKYFHPTFAKRSVPDAKVMLSIKNRAMEINKNRMHEKQRERHYLKKEHMDETSVRFHRASRVGLYEKLELLFKTLGWNGRECVLKKLCESGKRDAPQASFFHELLRIIFTFPKSDASDPVIKEEYDAAHASKEDCSLLFPDCREFDVPTNMMSNRRNDFDSASNE